MQVPKPNASRRFLTRGLVTGLLLAQTAINASAQNQPAAKPAEEVVTLDPFVVSGLRFGIEQSVATKRETVSLV